MKAVWLDLSIGEILEEEGKPTSSGQETVELAEKPLATERGEICILDGHLTFITGDMVVGLHNLLNISIQRINMHIGNKLASGENPEANQSDLLP